MQKFIIGYGAFVDLIDALDVEAAQGEAKRRSPPNDDPDYAWAEPYSDLMARDLGLLDDRRNAPWWG